MDETKKCPYCGGTIKAVAKKCRHCGRWLEDRPPIIQTAPEQTPPAIDTKQEINHVSTFLEGGGALILVYVALLSGIVDYVHTVGLRTTDITGSNKLLSPIIAATYVPEWVGTLCSGGAMLLFYIALYKGLQQIPKLSEMLKINVILWAVSYPLMFTSCFINEYSDAAVLIALITLIAGIANLVVQIRAGLFMCKNFSGNIADLGKWWIIYTVAYFVLLICAMLVAESNPNVAVILLIILIYPLYKSLTEFYVFLK